MMRKPILIIFLLQLLFLAGAGAEVDSEVPSFGRRTKLLGVVECTCDNPCGTPCSIPSPPPPQSLPPEYSYPPPPPIWPYPPPPPPYTPYVPSPPSAGLCPPTPWGAYSPPYFPWIYTPPGELYPQDPGYHPNGARRRRSVSLGRFATAAAAAAAGGVLALW